MSQRLDVAAGGSTTGQGGAAETEYGLALTTYHRRNESGFDPSQSDGYEIALYPWADMMYNLGAGAGGVQR
ncbi:MAG TPA: hypothetical protein VGF25_07980 [Thermoleophilaceae bacterium]